MESLLAERNALLAQSSGEEELSLKDKDRLDLIEAHFKKLHPVISQTSALELVAIDLELPVNVHLVASL